MRTKSTTLFPIVLLACLTAAACIEQDEDHTLYLDPDGKVTWFVVETNIRSTSEAPEDRAREEQEVLTLWARNEHPMAVALGELHPLSVECDLVRGERPFTIVTTARFARVEDALEGLGNELGIRNEARLERSTETTQLLWRLWVDETEQDTGDTADNELLDALTQFRFVLTEGKFVDSERFEISDDDTAATMAELDEDDLTDANGMVTFSLTW